MLDDKTGQPVPFATVALPARGTGTVADGAGHFALAAHRGDVVQISSLGYAAQVLTAADGKTVAVRLAPSAYALGDVRVSGESLDAKKIMRKVIQAIPRNYEQRDYAQQVYTHRRAINFDTLRHDVEYTSRLWTPAGYHNWAGGFLALEATPVEHVQEKHVLTQTAPAARIAVFDEGGHGFAGGFDPVRISPLFKSGTLGRYQLYLDTVEQHGDEAWYVIRFAAKRASHRTTGMYLTAGYSGRVYVRQADYAVVRYEALWQDDTVQNNAVARKYYGRNNQLTRLYDRVYDVSHNTHVVTYQRAADGHYYAAASIAQAAAVGRVVGKEPFYRQLTCEVYYAPPELVAKSELPDPKLKGDLGGGGVRQISDVPYHPAFWQTYQRPVPPEPAPPLPATTP